MRRIAVCVLALWPGGVGALTGQEFLEKCSDPSGHNLLICNSYMDGTVAAFRFLAASEAIERLGLARERDAVCNLGEFTSDEHRKIFLGFLIKNQERISYPAAWLFGISLREAFPCE